MLHGGKWFSYGDGQQMTDYTPGFQRWWSLYPSPRRKDKVKCFEKWKKHKLDDRVDDVVRKLEADVAYDWYDKELKYVPLSLTYLNGGRFDDDAPRPPRAMPHFRNEDTGTQVKLTKWQSMANRWMVKWLWVADGVDDLQAAIDIKNGCVREMSAPLDEDINAADQNNIRERYQAQCDAAWTFVSVLLDRLDQEFGRSIKGKLLREQR